MLVLIGLALGSYLVVKDYVSISGDSNGKLAPLVTTKYTAKKVQESLKKSKSTIQQTIGSE